MSQMNAQGRQAQQNSATYFPESWEWEGEQLELAYNPYDPTRSQMRPDYSRLVGEHGVCQPVVFMNRASGEEIRKFVVLAKVKAPAEPGSLVPDKYYRCFRLYDYPVDPRLVDWGTLVFYEIRPRHVPADANLNEAQRFMNTLLTGQQAAQQATQTQDDKWAEEFAAIRQQAGTPQPHDVSSAGAERQDDDEAANAQE